MYEEIKQLKFYTGIYSKAAYENLKAIVENCTYAFRGKFHLTVNCIETLTDGELVISLKNLSCDHLWYLRNGIDLNHYLSRWMNRYLAGTDKRLSPKYLQMVTSTWNYVFKDIDNEICSYLADYFQGIKSETMVRRYGQEFIDKVTGEKADPFEQEREQMKRDEIAKIKMDFEAKKNELKKSILVQIHKLQKDVEEGEKQFDAEMQIKIYELEKRYSV